METNKWEVRIAILLGCLFTFNSLGTCLMVGLGNSVWATMSGQSRFTMCVGIFVNWSGTMMAWFNRAISDLRKGKLPFVASDSGDTSMLTKSSVSPTSTIMKTALGLIALGWAVLIFGCVSFSTNLFRTEQALTDAAYTAYLGYTNGLYSGTIKVSNDESNAIKSARIKLAASVLTVEQWRSVYETNSAVKPEAQAALDALVSDSSNVVYLVNLVRSK